MNSKINISDIDNYFNTIGMLTWQYSDAISKAISLVYKLCAYIITFLIENLFSNVPCQLKRLKVDISSSNTSSTVLVLLQPLHYAIKKHFQSHYLLDFAYQLHLESIQCKCYCRKEAMQSSTRS